jgi:hypothetical protein
MYNSIQIQLLILIPSILKYLFFKPGAVMKDQFTLTHVDSFGAHALFSGCLGGPRPVSFIVRGLLQ